ncbi:MAG: hypothetical protein J6X07_03115 [Prevotella sp.]|nr:hypothetical protein [Prevotella sp.]
MQSGKIIWVWLVLALLLAGCTTGDEPGGQSVDDVPTVRAQFNFSLPQRIVGKRQTVRTRMTSDIVQETENEADFRGLGDIHMLCFDTFPTENTRKLGSMIEMKTERGEEIEKATDEDYSLRQEISIPIGTSHFSFYARADDAPRTHEERMHYGIIETVGLSKNTYRDNSAIRFRPVQICTSDEPFGGSAKGAALLRLLNKIMSVTGPEAAPDDKWATAQNFLLMNAYERMTQLKTLSSQNVQMTLLSLEKTLARAAQEERGAQLAVAIADCISEAFETPDDSSDPDDPNDPGDPDDSGETGDPVVKERQLKKEYQGFPDDLHLPYGSARIVWDEEKSAFVVPDVQAYGKEMDILSMSDYVYPMNLQYQVFSDIVASDSLVIAPTVPEPEIVDSLQTDSTQYSSWQELLDSVYVGASKVVEQSTQSVAMVQQVQYAVGRLALHTRIAGGTMYDAKGQRVDVSNGFTLKGYIIGGQHEVDYNFQPVANSREFAIYDTDLNGGPQPVRRLSWTDFDYILGLGTPSDKNIYIALELVNDGNDFEGADGTIFHGATFYLVANLNPSEGTNYTIGSLDRIFSKDHATQVHLTISEGWPDKDGDDIPDPDLDEKGQPKPLNGLATATYGMPNLDISRPTLGLSVNLRWEEGLWFDDIEFE